MERSPGVDRVGGEGERYWGGKGRGHVGGGWGVGVTGREVRGVCGVSVGP